MKIKKENKIESIVHNFDKISQAVQISGSFYIIVIIDALYTVQNIQLLYISISTLINHNFKRP